MNNIAKIAAAAALSAAFSMGAQAQESAGSWLIKGGVMSIMPDSRSGDLSAPSQPGTKIDTSSGDTQLAGGIVYMITEHWSVEVPLALPFKYDIKGAGTIDGVGKIGETRAMPATLFAQYRFLGAGARLRPYVGLGLTYAYFFDEKGNGTLTGLTNPGGGEPTKLDIDSKFALTPQLGVVWHFNDRWFAEVMGAKTFLKTTSSLSTGQKIDITLDPWTAGAFVGYRF
ncbi:OmpW/AlkL family protein [Solimonas soli]|uniref:OmpW/AlkL family protein n=1 Tax=Solimonas soli TaxID=413479 RepID=UPI0004842EF7|nr:OmpW family outer membrane protein [Solimonas soli]